MGGQVRVVATADELDEGLFGQVFLWIFEILPYLARRKVFPDWEIHALHYGGQAQTVIPGVLDLTYSPPAAARDIPLALLRRRRCAQLGNDWAALNRLWTSYFRIPAAVERDADAMGRFDDALGVHYRGTDKLAATWDTNPVHAADMIAIIKDFLGRRPDLTRIFLATDDKSFAGKLRDSVGCEVLNLGEVEFHKEEGKAKDDLTGAFRALLDSVVLSRCRAVLLTSSALSGFTKVWNPDLEVYRCAASKQFADIPYFPVAYIEPYASSDPHVEAILERLFQDDWNGRQTVAGAFRSRARSWKKAIAWTMVEAFEGSPVGWRASLRKARTPSRLSAPAMERAP